MRGRWRSLYLQPVTITFYKSYTVIEAYSSFSRSLYFTRHPTQINIKVHILSKRLQFLFDTCGASLFNFWNYFVWLRITDGGSVPEMDMWSIFGIKSDWNWCIYLSTNPYINDCHCWWISGYPTARCSYIVRSMSVDSHGFDSIKLLIETEITWVHYHPFWLQLLF